MNSIHLLHKVIGYSYDCIHNHIYKYFHDSLKYRLKYKIKNLMCTIHLVTTCSSKFNWKWVKNRSKSLE